MSIDNAKAFMKRMTTDKDFRDSVGAAKDKEERMKLVKDAGFEFNIDHLQAAHGELSDEDLQIVSGGDGSGLWSCHQTCEQSHQEHCTPASEGMCGMGDSL